MNVINIKDIDLNNSFFHFTCKDNFANIEKEGLKAKIGDASKLKTEEEQRVYMSKGGKGILSIKNSFIYEFKCLRVCDIPMEYRKYFNFEDYSKKDQLEDNEVYEAMEKRFKDEIYLKVDAVEGEDFILEKNIPKEIDKITDIKDLKGKVNHDINPKKLSLIITDNGNTALEVLEYLYNRLLENASKSGKVDVVKMFNSDLDGLFEYIKRKKINNEIY